MLDSNTSPSTLPDLRVELLRAETLAASGKISSNGSYGKMGNKWSVLYSPELIIQTTLTGQLSLLMLIEMLEDAGISVISANTDGIAIKCERVRESECMNIIATWEKITKFTIETTDYSSLHSANVNNYVAVKTDGTVKTKGWFAIDESTVIQKNPTNMVAVDAVIGYLTEGLMPEDTIAGCKDVRRFVTIRKVEGGGMTNSGEYLGRAVRWYYANPDKNDLIGGREILYKKNGNRVARSEGAKPLMELPDALPDDVDTSWYVREAYSMLRDVGVTI